MKRFLTLLLAAAMVLSFAACGDNGTTIRNENEEDNVKKDPIAAQYLQDLAVKTADYPVLPAMPNESELDEAFSTIDYDKMGADAYEKAQEKIWEDWDARSNAYYDALKALRSKDFVFSDDLVLSSSKEPAAELLRESASVRTTECRLIGGKIILKGVVCVEVLYLSESGTICSAAAELPFSQIVEGVEDADENTSAEAMLCLTGAELRIGGESGDARTISAKLFLHAFVVLRQRLCLRCITDLYSTSCDLSAQMQTLELCGGVETVTQEQNVREQIETGVEVSAVLCAEVHFGSVSLVQEESTANVRCTAILRVLYLDEGGAPLMVERRTEVAARIAVPEGCTAAVRCVTAFEVSAAATANGIEVRFPALFTLECTRRCRCACLCALKAEPQQESGGRQPTLVLRAMGAEERLWDLAKAYRTTVAEILTANELSAEADAPGGEMLLIPCRR